MTHALVPIPLPLCAMRRIVFGHDLHTVGIRGLDNDFAHRSNPHVAQSLVTLYLLDNATRGVRCISHGVTVSVAVAVAVSVGVLVAVSVGVLVGVGVNDCAVCVAATAVWVAWIAATVAGKSGVLVAVLVAVGVSVGVFVAVAVSVGVGVTVGAICVR